MSSLETERFWILLIGLAWASAFFLIQFVYLVRKRRLMADTPTSKIRSASQGFVEITGRTKALDGPLISPGKGLGCVWYRYSVEDLRDSEHSQGMLDAFRALSNIGGLLKSDRFVSVDESIYSFYVDDGTGLCSVDPSLGQVRSNRKDIWKKGRHRYIEERIAEGDEVYCLGEFKTIQGVSRQQAIEQTMRATLHQWKHSKSGLKQFDANGDGIIDQMEWDSARAKALDLAKREVSESYQSIEHHELVKPFDSMQPYVISVFMEEDLAKRYLFHIAYSLPGFLVSGALLTMMLYTLT